MFEMKYDSKTGEPIRNKALEDQLNKAADTQELVHEQVTERLSAAQPPQAEQEQVQETQEESQNESDATPSVQNAPKTPEQSFRELRSKADRLERERDDQARRIAELERLALSMAQQQPNQPQQPQEDDDLKLGDDDFAEGKHLSKLGRKVKRQDEKIQQTRAELEMQLSELKLRTKYPDIDGILTTDNLQKLNQQDPDLGDMIKNYRGDTFKQAEIAYKFIKQLGIAKDSSPEAPLGQVYRGQEKELIAKNMAKPKPSNTVIQSPLKQATAFAEGLTPDIRKQLLAEMTAARKTY